MRAAQIGIALACWGPGVLACGASNSAVPCDDAAAHTSTGIEGTTADAAGGDALGAGDSTGAGDAPPAEGGAQAAETTSPGSAEDSGIDSAPSPVSFVRFANWSADSPGVDFCIAPHGSGAYTGPVVGALSASTGGGSVVTTADGGTMSLLDFPLVSAYLSVAPGQYDVRLVVAGATSCLAAIGLDATGLPALGANALTTVALVGEDQPVGGDPGLEMVAFADDSTPSVSGISMRFVNASPGQALVDVGKGTGVKFSPIFLGVPFGHAGTAAEAQVGDATPPFVDRHGYATVGATSEATFSVYAAGAEANPATFPVVSSTAWVAAAGTIVTIAIVGGTSAGAPARLLQCADNAGTVGPLGDCSLF